ncbi:hypothetical protein MZM54_05460 [[Brevibacterium] frigoritolerans]|nr:hypothetical protein [Peribacillus frigoritolerans]
MILGVIIDDVIFTKTFGCVVIGIILFGFLIYFADKKTEYRVAKMVGNGIAALVCLGFIVGIGSVVYMFVEAQIHPNDPQSMEDSRDYPDEPSSESSPGYHSVDGYYRSDGTYVEPHIRSNPDGILSNNINQ